MRFGLFVPQGWRLDLVGIDPDAQWDVMRGIAEHADRGDQWESMWVVGREKADGALGAFRRMPACGTPEQIVENLSALRDRGMSYGIFYRPELAYDRSGLELFEREVVPALSR